MGGDVHPHPRTCSARATGWSRSSPRQRPCECRRCMTSTRVPGIQRASRDGGRDWDNPGYLRWHRSGPPVVSMVVRATAPIGPPCRHRAADCRPTRWGMAQANLLQAADSFPFLETMVSVTIGWCRRGVPLERAEGKLSWMARRSRSPGSRRRRGSSRTSARPALQSQPEAAEG